MISDALQKWAVVIVICLSGVHPQMMPMGFGFGGPMMMPMPMPMPMPVPVGIPIPCPESTTTTSTTTTPEANNGGGDNGMAIAIPMPMPHFVQIAIPAVMPPNCMPNNKKDKNKNKNCPPCPPCSCNPCTPSFFSFCSPCHLECRCKNGKENPIPKEPNPPQPMPGPAFPMPIPMIAPPPVVVVPFPPQFGRPKKPPHESDCDSRPVSKSNSCSEESKPKDSCESDRSWRKKKRKRKKKKSKYDIQRRNFDLVKRNRGDGGLVEPVLSYMSRNGEIMMKRRLSNDEADALMDDREPYNMRSYNRDGETYNNVRLMAREDEYDRPRLVVMSNPGMRGTGKHRRIQQVLDKKSSQVLRDGKKELIFKTPGNKKISNLSLSFQIGN